MPLTATAEVNYNVLPIYIPEYIEKGTKQVIGLLTKRRKRMLVELHFQYCIYVITKK